MGGRHREGGVSGRTGVAALPSAQRSWSMADLALSLLWAPYSSRRVRQASAAVVSPSA